MINVFILATCRKPELIDAACLVFKTLRVGFPNSRIKVFVNGDFPETSRNELPELTEVGFVSSGSKQFLDRASRCKANQVFYRINETIHHNWIAGLIASENEPFYICDTDIVFTGSAEDWKFDGALAGQFIPAFYDRFTNCIHQPRLHTSLLYIDPVKVRAAISTWNNGTPDTPFTPKVNLIDPLVMPSPNGPVRLFFDTCSLLYHAIGGQRFTEDQLSAYEHLNCATWVDMIEPAYPGMTAIHREIYKDPSRAVGLRKVQQRFYEQCAA